MILKHTMVQFTVLLSEIEIDKEVGLPVARDKIRLAAERILHNEGADQTHILDCPDYPALCD